MNIPAGFDNAIGARRLGHGRAKCNFTPRAAQRRGIILVLVAAVIVMLSLLGMSFLVHVSTENRAVHVQADQLQRAALLASGAELLGVLVEQPPALRQSAGGCWDNPALLRGVLVFHDEASKRHGRVSIVAPKLEGDAIVGVRFGAENESAKLSLAALLEWDAKEPGRGEEALMNLPGMSQPMAAAIMDWLDADWEPRFNGAEADYYASQYLSYGPRNGVPVNLEELLLVRDVPRELLLGADTDANYQLDRGQPGGAAMAIGGTTGVALPWSSLLTVHSAERNVNARGQPRIDLNQPDLAQLYRQLARRLDPELSAFIVLYRQYGPWEGEPEPEPVEPLVGEVASGQKARAADGKPISAPGAEGMVQGNSDSQPTRSRKPISAPYTQLQAQQSPPEQGQMLPAITFRPDRDPLGAAQIGAGQSGPLPPDATGAAALFPGSLIERLIGEPAEQLPGAWPSLAPGQLSPPIGSGKVGAGQSAPQHQITSVFDLVGARVRVPHPAGGPGWIIESPIQDIASSLRNYLPQLLDETTVDRAPVIYGRVNINLAPLAVLRAIPGMDSYLAAQIVAARQQAPDAPERQHPAWPLLEGIVDLPTMRALLPYLTTGGDVYRAQIIGYFDQGGPQVRAEVVIDATVAPARLVYFKQLDISAPTP